MNLKHLVLAVIMAASAASASSAVINHTFTTPLTCGGGACTAGFTDTFTSSGTFTDIFNFTPTTIGGDVSGSLITITLKDPTNTIHFTTADINGAGFTFTTFGPATMGTLTFATLSAPLVMTVNGAAGSGTGLPIAASFSGTVNVVPVPEPETIALLGLGLIGIGLARRRKQT